SLSHFVRLENVEGQISGTLIHSYDTETRATMTMASSGDFLASGQDASCHILRFREPKHKTQGQKAGKNEGKGANKTEVRKRKPGNRTAGDGSGDLHREAPAIVVESLNVVQTDFSTDALQKAVRLNHDASLLVTGGADGYIRVWEFPSMKKTLDFKAHSSEVEDVDIGPDNKVVSVGRDFTCCVWKKDQLVMGLSWTENMPHVAEKSYRYQACRFGNVEDNEEAFRLYTVQIPHKRERKPLPCYISKWDGRNFLPLLTRGCGNEVISSLAVSDQGTFIGLGTITGSVAIYIAFSLQRVYYVKEAHGIVVTDLAFLPDTSPAGREILGHNEVALLSVAVDSRCKLHLLPNRRLFPIWFVLLLCGLLIVFTILLLQHVFPGLL
uniref:Prolactin regulatory element binding n=1 Tax=Callorhinchus milii TaxID=7868 RepID=A0A4W3HY35_CALMI